MSIRDINKVALINQLKRQEVDKGEGEVCGVTRSGSRTGGDTFFGFPFGVLSILFDHLFPDQSVLITSVVFYFIWGEGGNHPRGEYPRVLMVNKWCSSKCKLLKIFKSLAKISHILILVQLAMV